MRKSKYQISEEEAWKVFDKSTFSTLACIRANATPYVVALSIARIEDKLYFHCALEGDKVDALLANPQVCVSSIGSYQNVSNQFTVVYESVVFEGTAQIVKEESEKIIALRAISEKFSSEAMKDFESAVNPQSLGHTAVFKINVTSITGKRK